MQTGDGVENSLEESRLGKTYHYLFGENRHFVGGVEMSEWFRFAKGESCGEFLVHLENRGGHQLFRLGATCGREPLSTAIVPNEGLR